MLLIDLVRTSTAVAGESSRLSKTSHLAELLRSAGDQAALCISYLAGELPQRQIGVGWAALRELPAPAAEPGLTPADVDSSFEAIKAVSGPGSQTARRTLLAGLFGDAVPEEQAFLVRLLTGELRQGALDGVMTDAVAAASGVPVKEIRRALTLHGSLPAVGAVALSAGVEGLRAIRLEPGRGLRPMLAASAGDLDAALSGSPGERVALEWKIDGVRVQAHRAGERVTVFTRTLDDITDRVPELVATVRALPVRSAVLDGELIALRADGRPHPFQVTSARVATRTAPPAEQVPLSVFFFDLLHLDGRDLLDSPAAERWAELAEAVPEPLRIPRLVTADPEAAREFFRQALAHGQEGVIVKSLSAPYAAGRRGAGWIKVKPRHTLDLVVLAAEWGHGRRQGYLSNLHLGARDPASGGFVMLGKTFKGLTDALLTWQTERFLELAESPADGWTVRVRPELVVEIAFDGVQTSPRYPGGMALRFARVLRYRPDKRPEDADTVETVREILAAQDLPEA
ncbi:ATP-dependent DNA ligase [Rhizohabitans arisaemae]|uniref:ATP-dependent DNA ligase n=1 Tax=Rhizohabitans arisaemae TaxID=2720610 RepID=UPI0024B04F9B|nr:ATP-dependent DNA ligase [Rhizohabitans arisaemae]